MPMDRFLISPINTGLQTNLKPWQILDDAFTSLENVYVFRGRIKKRFGSLLMGNPPTVLNSRLRVNIGTTDGAGNFSGTVPGSIFKIGQLFSIGSEIFTVYQTGAPGIMLDTGSATVKTFNTTTGAVVINGAAALTTVYYYPAEPVLGLTQFETGAVNNHPSYAFDTQFAYFFASPGWERSKTTNGLPMDIPVFHDPNGTQNNYFWTTNWTGVADNNVTLYVTNFQIKNPTGLGVVTDDPIWTLTNAGGTNTWAPFSYSPDANINYENVQPLTVTTTNKGNVKIITNYVQSARIIVPFKNRLLLLNTIENNANGATAYDPTNHGTRIASGITPANYLTSTNSSFPNRCRYSHNGSPFATNAWLEPGVTYNPGSTGVVVADGGGFFDAATDEQIISAEFIKDRLIVYFERSTWEIAYTGNEILPFVWQKINTELGSQSTFSSVPFDREVYTIGNTGVHACNGSNVERIDEKIPDEIFDDFDSTETVRTGGIRDYFSETVYWTFVDTDRGPFQNFPTRILVFNYRNRSWALNDDSVTAFGYFEQQSDLTWSSSAPITWATFSGSWVDSIVQANQRQIIMGYPEGFVLRLARDISRNYPYAQITNMSIAASGIITLSVINHNLSATPSSFPNDSDFILIENVVADSATQTFLNGTIFPVYSVIDANTITINTFGGLTTGTYYGAGTISRVCNTQMTTKQFNPYVTQDRNVYLAKVDFGVEKTETGQITVDYYPSSSPISMIQGGVASGSIMGNNVLETSPYSAALYPLEQYQDLLWHPIYFQSSGQFIQLALYLTPDQMINPNISLSDFELEGMILYTQPTSARLE